MEPRQSARQCGGLLRIVLAAMFGLCAVQCGHAQGFDWQYSARMPAAYPTFFMGITLGGDLLSYSGSLYHVEKVKDPINGDMICRDCGPLEGGSGHGLSFGVRAEQWFEGTVAVSGAVIFQRVQSRATRELPPIPSRFYGPVRSELEFTAADQYLHAEVQGRYRLLQSHVYVGGGFSAAFLLSSDVGQEQRILSPAEAGFEVEGRIVQRREVNGEFTESSSVFVAAKVLAGIDVALARGLYASPALSLSIPLLSPVQDADWRRLAFGVQLSILYGSP